MQRDAFIFTSIACLSLLTGCAGAGGGAATHDGMGDPSDSASDPPTSTGSGTCLGSSQLDYLLKPTVFNQGIPGGAILTDLAGDAQDIFFVAESLYSVSVRGGEPVLRYPSRVHSYWVRTDDVVVQDHKQIVVVPRAGGAARKLAPLSVAADAGVLVGDKLFLEAQNDVRKDGATGNDSSDYHSVATYFTRDIESGDESVLFEAETNGALSQRFAVWNEIAYVATGPEDADRHLYAVPLDGSDPKELDLGEPFNDLEVIDANDAGLLLFGRAEGHDRSVYRLPLQGGSLEEIEGGRSIARAEGFLIKSQRGEHGVAFESLGDELWWVPDGESKATLVACFSHGFTINDVVPVGDVMYADAFFEGPSTGGDGKNGVIRIAIPNR